MPTVPRVTRQVNPIAIPGARLTAHETAESLGAGVAEARGNAALMKGRADQQRWSAVAEFGETAMRAAGPLAQIAIAERRRADEVALMDADNQLSKWENEALYNPQTGAMTLQGKQALGSPEAVTAAFEQRASEIEGTLSTDRQRAAFQRIRMNRGARIDLTLRRHVAGEIQKYEATELKSLVENATNAAIQNANDPARVGFELGKAVQAIEASGPRLGLGPEAIENQVEAVRNVTHTGVIESLVSQGHTSAARAYFEEAKDAGQLTGPAVARVEKALHEGTLRKRAQEESDKILAAGGTLTEQRDKAKAIDDPEVRDNVLQRLEHEATVREREERQVSETRLRSVYATLEQNGGDIDAVDPAVWSQLDAKDLAPARAYARALAKGEPIETDLELYYGLMKKAAGGGAAFLNENLMRYKDRLSEGDFKHFADMQRALASKAIDAANDAAKSKTKMIVDEFVSRSQLFDDRLRLYGINPNAKEGTPEAQAIANLRGIVDRRVRALGGGETGKSATNDEIREILDEELNTRVLVPNPNRWGGFAWWRPENLEKRPMELTLEDLSPDDRTRIEAALRKNRIPVNDATVLEAFIEARTRK